MNTLSELPPASESAEIVPPKPHPVDVALAALSEVAAELLASGKSSRFAEAQQVMVVASYVQRLRVPLTVDDVDAIYGDRDDDGVMVYRNPIRRVRHGGRFNDAVDLNREILMLAQSFLAQYAEAEKKKASKPDPDVRLNEVAELVELYGLRLKLALAGKSVPGEINVRIDHLLKRIGEPTYESEPSSILHSDPLRRYPPDGAGEPDGGRVGESLAERAGGDDGAG